MIITIYDDNSSCFLMNNEEGGYQLKVFYQIICMPNDAVYPGKLSCNITS